MRCRINESTPTQCSVRCGRSPGIWTGPRARRAGDKRQRAQRPGTAPPSRSTVQHMFNQKIIHKEKMLSDWPTQSRSNKNININWVTDCNLRDRPRACCGCKSPLHRSSSPGWCQCLWWESSPSAPWTPQSLSEAGPIPAHKQKLGNCCNRDCLHGEGLS